MIPRSDIISWRKIAPWQSNEQVEHDLIISRSLVEIFSDGILQRHLAFRGGTALYKLYLAPQVRYSEDIDLVQIKPGAIGEIFDKLKEQLSFLGTPTRRQRERNNTLIFKFESEIPPTMPLKLKIEINCREHFSIFGFAHREFSVSSRWFSGKAVLTTYSLEELLGSKMRALYQRKQGRDLFDLWYALTKTEAKTRNIVEAFKGYMESSGSAVSRKQFLSNLERKIVDSDFRADLTGLLKMDQTFDVDEAFAQVLENLISKI